MRFSSFKISWTAIVAALAGIAWVVPTAVADLSDPPPAQEPTPPTEHTAQDSTDGNSTEHTAQDGTEPTNNPVEEKKPPRDSSGRGPFDARQTAWEVPSVKGIDPAGLGLGESIALTAPVTPPSPDLVKLRAQAGNQLSFDGATLTGGREEFLPVVHGRGAVPTPGSLVLIGIGGLVLRRRRRR